MIYESDDWITVEEKTKNKGWDAAINTIEKNRRL